MAVVVINLSGVVQSWNAHAETLLGWSSTHAVGKRLKDLILPPEAKASYDEMLPPPSWKSKHPVRQQKSIIPARHKEGHRLSLVVEMTPLENREEILFQCNLQDTHFSEAANELSSPLQHELVAMQAAVARLMQCAQDIVCIVDSNGHIRKASPATQSILGYKPDELVGTCIYDLFRFTGDKEAARQVLTSAPNFPTTIEVHAVHKDGRNLHIRWTFQWYSDARVTYCVGRDVTLEKTTIFAIRERDERFRSLFEHHPDGVFQIDMHGRLQTCSATFCTLTGYSLSELQGKRYFRLLRHDEIPKLALRAIRIRGGHAQRIETTGRRKDGTQYDVMVMVMPLMVEGQMVGFHGMARDISAVKESERRVEYLSTRDVLTGLPNRALLMDRLQHALSKADRHGHTVGVLFMDLARFKAVNDSFGHAQGDDVLRIIGDRLKHTVRGVDTIGRYGSDEFIVIVEDIGSVPDLINIGRNLIQAVERPIDIEGHKIYMGVNIGCSLYPRHADNAATLVRNADLAMYEAKSIGPGAFRLFTADMNERVKVRLVGESQLRRALESKELVVHYQPRIDMRTHRVVGAEALVRWQHPERGLVPPNEFIPLAEELGLIGRLGEWVLHTACRQNRHWQDMGFMPIKISVNLSPLQLMSGSSLVSEMRTALLDNDLDPQWLELEITESTLMQNVEATLSMLAEIRSSGVSISIDDFGTGYSSLSYLRRLPVNTLKIDQSFIRDLTTNRDGAAIVSATIALAHTLQLKVVAEGVNNKEQVEFLQAHECDEAQGYLLGRPVPAEEMALRLDKSLMHAIVGRSSK
ncbi:sensor domain-containing protein [Noviherbaspirillum aerium]|uniref:sensor domain-containing protein n=1 Tax=Noviherbaspirillum aerium TaxID=2588497 RepID=UPI00178C5CAB|nr:bifunctional diguanylate cyclase/phosphodiesterase [Noviherbaspirillum aerium]